MKKQTNSQLQSRVSYLEAQLERIFQALTSICVAQQIHDTAWEELDLWRTKQFNEKNRK
jgi:hypothetical protein